MAYATSSVGTTLISVGGVIVAAVISAAVAIFQSRRNGRLQVALAAENAKLQADLAHRNSVLQAGLERLKSDLQTEVQTRTALAERENRAEEVLKRYREPLAAAAFDLQSRLYNILRKNFFLTFRGNPERLEVAEETTLFRIAQYFGWTEILRRDIQFLSFPEATETREVVASQVTISKHFLTGSAGAANRHGLMIWSDEQRAIGEKMIVEEFVKVLCMGYARFHDEYQERFATRLDRLRPEMHAASEHVRMKALQHELSDLVRTLDPDGLRYSDIDLQKA